MRSRRFGVLLGLGLTAAGLTAGYLFKRPCNAPRTNNYHYTHGCYSDIGALYSRASPPFVEQGDRSFAEGGVAYRDNDFEYPALTGLFVSSVNAAVARGEGPGFVRANAWGLALFALAGGAGLGAIALRRWRLLLYGAAPAFVAYAFHNWDLIAVGATGVGLWAFVRRRDEITGVALGLGAAAKIFPALVLPALLLARRREGVGLTRLSVTAAGAFAVPNMIVLAIGGWDAWGFPWRFQSMRLPNFETVWYFLGRHFGGDVFEPARYAQLGVTGVAHSYGRVSQTVASMLFVAAAALLIRAELRRPEFRPIVAAFGIVILFLLTTKVFSPQYAIWLLPFFVLTSVPIRGFVAFAAADLFVLAAIFGLGAHFREPDAGWWLNLVEAAVAVRCSALVYLLWLSRRSSDLVERSPLTVQQGMHNI